MGKIAKPRVLIVAQNASARFGGEAFLPLKYFQILKKRSFSVKLITHSRNRRELEELFPMDIDDVTFLDDTIFHHIISKVSNYTSKIIQENIFGNLISITDEIRQRQLIYNLVQSGDINLIHQPIPVSPLAPSTIFGFGVPVIIGPMNGGMDYPPGYSQLQSKWEKRTVSLFRKIARMVNVIIPGKRRASVLLVANERTRAALPAHKKERVQKMSENGVDLDIWKKPQIPHREHSTQQFRLAFVGRLIELKALDVTLRAVEICRKLGADVVLEIIGDGPDRERLESIAHFLDITTSVKFHGFKTQRECVVILQECDGLILNSLRECGGAVVLEAMSLGLPVIGSDWGGPSDYIDSECGILVSPIPQEGFDQRLSDALLSLVSDPSRSARMGAAGEKKVRKCYDWEKKIDQVIEVYESALRE